MADCRAIEEFKVENKSLREELEKMKMEMELFKLGYDPADDVVLFPVYSRSGEILFFKSRSLVGKSFFNAKDIDKTAAVYGLFQTVAGQIPADTEIWLVESEIDALFYFFSVQINLPAL